MGTMSTNGNGTGKRAILYARVSSDDRGKDGRNLAGQIEMCREYAERKGWAIVAELQEDDRGASGAAFDLPQLTTALEMAAQGEYDVFVTREVDRLARGLAKQLIIEQELKQSGVKIEYALGEYDDTPEGALMKNVRAVIAEYERLKITERTSRARRRKVRDGHVLLHNVPAPYGYRHEEVDGRRQLVIVPERADVVRMMFDWYAGNKRHSLYWIAEQLTEMRIPTPTELDEAGKNQPSKGWKKKGYGEWARSTIYQILRNETYAGVWHYGKNGGYNTEDLPSVEVPAIVSRGTWDKVQARFAENRKKSNRNVKYDYLVRGRVKCGRCNTPAAAEPHKAGGRLYLYYRCCAANGKGYAHKCDMPYFRAERVDAAVWDWAQSIIVNRDGFRDMVEEYRQARDERSQPTQRRLEATDKVLAENQQKLDAAIDLYLDGHITKEEMLERRGRFEKAIASLQEKRAEIVADMQGQYLSDEQLDSMLALIDEMAVGFDEAEESFEARRHLIELMGLKAELLIRDGKQKVEAWVVFGEKALLDVSSDS